ncbi:MAG: hypothetical protein KGI06_06375, partial [Candidatus Micrarchaeota archaeon]|nr:hypothetical protein [Candidatus Micrarchaeota archaeon]
PIEEDAITFPLSSVARMPFVSPVNQAVVRVVSVDELLAKIWSLLQVLPSERREEEAAVTVFESPRLKVVPLMVTEEFRSLLLAMEPASMVLVTEPVSVV